MDKRKYTKKSSYWDKFSRDTANDLRDTVIALPSDAFEPDLLGEPFYTQANTLASSGSESTRYRASRNATSKPSQELNQIANFNYPFVISRDSIAIKEAIDLVVKAYFNIAIIFNTIEMMVEFSNTDLFLDSGSVKSKKFFESWFEKINVSAIKEQFFREYFRSGNIFLYRIDGKFALEDYQSVANIGYSGAQNRIPLRYLLLNPIDIVSDSVTNYTTNNYKKVLSLYELQKLKSPTDQREIEVLNSLPPDVQKKIKEGSFVKDGVYMRLDPEKMRMSFYKKQDYEPFGIPFSYRVLRDVNAKLELKKVDLSITRAVENVILLITMGAEPEKGGINQKAMRAMQDLFRSEASGRVLVSDYTTKAEFIIPDLKKVLGPEKYQILDQDIKEGLQNIIVGKENYSSTEMKADMFLERLRSAREAFLRDFLQPEIRRVEKDMGFKVKTTAKFKDLELSDETTMLRVITRLVELGVLTPGDAMEVIKTGDFPTPERILAAQEEFVQNRKKGYYNPIVGGVPVLPPPLDPNAQLKAATSVNKTPKSAGRPTGKKKATLSSIRNVIGDINKLTQHVQKVSKTKFGIDELSTEQIGASEDLAMAVASSDMGGLESWKTKIDSLILNDEDVDLTPCPEVLSLSTESNMELNAATLVSCANRYSQ